MSIDIGSCCCLVDLPGNVLPAEIAGRYASRRAATQRRVELANQHRMPLHHPRVIGTKHMAASASYLAAQVGFEILEGRRQRDRCRRRGRHRPGVLQCEYVHFAGVAPIMIHPGRGQPDGVDQRSRAVAEARQCCLVP